jgi:hypothetical protein
MGDVHEGHQVHHGQDVSVITSVLRNAGHGLGGEFFLHLVFIPFESFVQGLQPELPVARESLRLQGPWTLAGMWFRVVCPDLSPAQCHFLPPSVITSAHRWKKGELIPGVSFHLRL